MKDNITLTDSKYEYEVLFLKEYVSGWDIFKSGDCYYTHFPPNTAANYISVVTGHNETTGIPLDIVRVRRIKVTVTHQTVYRYDTRWNNKWKKKYDN